MDGPGGWDWQSNLRHIASGGYNVGDIVNGWRWDGVSWTREGGGGGGSGGGGSVAPPFEFDWAAAEKEALAKLEPYYLQKLQEAEFDVERAKRLIEEDYQRGVRYRSEDLATEIGDVETAKKRIMEDYERGETYRAQDLEQQLRELGLITDEDRRDLRAELNARGVLIGEMGAAMGAADKTVAPDSQYAKDYHLSPFEEKAQMRQLAIERAIQRQSEVAGIEKERGLTDTDTGLNKFKTQQQREGEEANILATRGKEEYDIEFPRYKKALEEEKKEKAVLQMAPLKYQQELTKYRALNELPS